MSDVTPQVPPAPPAEALTPVVAARVPDAAPAAPGLRLWPAVVIVVAQWLLMKVPGWVAPGTFPHFLGMFWGPIIGAAAFVLWWLFASRLRWADRLLVLLACLAIGAASFFTWHPTFTAFGLIIYALPTVTTAWAGWLLGTQSLRWPVRRAGLLALFVLVWPPFTLIRFEGVDGSMSATLAYRWSTTSEAKFLAERAALDPGRPARALAALKPLAALTPSVLQPGDWPGFRGPARDGRRPGVRIATDWQTAPPRPVWRHRVGPGWSSFAVVGTRLYTQEQRGEDEVVVCYDADTGSELWAHRDTARFTEVVAGPGPRGTPTFHEGKLYTLGAAGRLNCLDAVTGGRAWSSDITADASVKVRTWGFASSPLVIQGVVTVFAGGPGGERDPGGKSVLGYDAATGKLVWAAGEGKLSYCSPQRAVIDGEEQVLVATEAGVTAFQPADGEVLWHHAWPVKDLARVVQPALVGDADLLLGTGFGYGTRRVRVERGGSQWTTQEVWTTKAIKPYYNDLVVHKGHLYGFDGLFFTCVRLDDGKGLWKVRGYGNGQVLLLPDQDLLLILSEKGEAVLVEASPAGHNELGKFQALEGKTWNHPVVAHGKLFVRNGEEAACYQLTDAPGGQKVSILDQTPSPARH